MDPSLAKVLHQASHHHHMLLGRAVVGWHPAAQLIFAQARRGAAFGSSLDSLGPLLTRREKMALLYPLW
eukprot:4524611-Lingulodinium_polyedra.AAC.1